MWSEVDIFLVYKANLTQKYTAYFKENRQSAAKKYLLIEHIAVFSINGGLRIENSIGIVNENMIY